MPSVRKPTQAGTTAAMWRKNLARLAVSASLGLALGAGLPGAPAQAQFTIMSPEQEKRIGAEEHPKVLAQYGGAYDNPQVAGYVAMLGGRLLSNSPMAGEDFTFTVVNSPIVNAFALPGGYVYVSRGLVALANSEAELAGVVGHEIAHVTERHTAERYTRAVGVTGLAVIGQILGDVFIGGGAGQIAGSLINTGGQLYVLKYGRDQEYEADEVGLVFLDRAGYDPFAMADFLDSMRAKSTLTAKLSGREYDPDGVDYFSTHPNTSDRVRRAAQVALQTGATQGDRPRNEGDFFSTVQGMLYGDDPKEGIVNGREFKHPDLRLAFTAPENFRIQNTTKAVLGSGPNNTRFAFDGGKTRTSNIRTYLTDNWASKMDVRLTGVETGQINGMPFASGFSRQSVDGKPALLKLIAIQFDRESVYRFQFIVPEAVGNQMGPQLDRMAQSFKKLSQSEASKIRSRSLQVVTVRRGDTVESLANRMAFNDNKLERFRVLNGLGDGETLKAGQKVKLVTF